MASPACGLSLTFSISECLSRMEIGVVSGGGQWVDRYRCNVMITAPLMASTNVIAVNKTVQLSVYK